MKRYILILLFAPLLCACVKQQVQTYYDKQQKIIEDFVASQKTASETVYNSKSIRIVLKEGTTEETLSSHGVVSFYYDGYVLSNKSISSGNLFATNRSESKWNVTDEDGEAFAIKTLKLDEAPLLEGLRDGLEGVRGGEECYIVFLGKYGYGNHALGTIPANATLAYHIWVESISNE